MTVTLIRPASFDSNLKDYGGGVVQCGNGISALIRFDEQRGGRRPD